MGAVEGNPLAQASRAASTSDQIVSKGETLKLESGAVKAKYINKTREQVSNECNNAQRMESAAGFFAAVGGTAVAVALAAILGGVSLAAMATPVGWGVAGAVVIAAAILVVRNHYMKKHDLDTGTGAGFAFKCFGWPIALAVAIIGGSGSFGGGKKSIEKFSERVDKGKAEIDFIKDSSDRYKLHNEGFDWEAPYISKDGELLIYSGEEVVDPKLKFTGRDEQTGENVYTVSIKKKAKS